MSNDPTTPTPPVAYSTDTVPGEATLTGHTVTIAPGQLAGAIATFTKDTAGQGPEQLVATLTTAMLGEDDFGTIPGADAITRELQSFITGHAEVMTSMGTVLADFVARVQAAAQLGYQTDPETRMELARARAHMT